MSAGFSFSLTPVTKIQISIPSEEHRYEVAVGAGSLQSVGAAVRSTCPGAEKVVIVSNEKVFGLYGAAVVRSLESEGIAWASFLMPDGEECKSLETASEALAVFTSAKLSRSDAVVALGGGVVGDLTGFAASVYLRGIRFIQVPTTLLAMIDASVGGKTGVNTDFGKNLVGSFHHPAGVIADIDCLSTLEERELRSGMYEAVKQCALKGKDELVALGDFLGKYPLSQVAGSDFSAELRDDFSRLVEEQVRFKANVVMSDAREEPGRADRMSRKVLNFGHTTAHALEKVTGFTALTHGEAVGFGMLAAGNIGKLLEISPADSIGLLNDVVRRVGVLPSPKYIAIDDVLNSIEFDKKARGGSVEWILLEDIGKPVIVPGPEIPSNVIKESIENAISH